MKNNKDTIISIILIMLIGLVTIFSWQLYKNKEVVIIEGEDIIKTEHVTKDYIFPEKPNTKYLNLYNFSINIEDTLNTTGKTLLNNEKGLICEESDPLSSLPSRTRLIKKEDNDYCLKAFSEGAAGKIYTEYEISYLKDKKLYTLSFLGAFPQCGNYPEEQMIECQQERESFNLEDYIINNIKQFNF